MRRTDSVLQRVELALLGAAAACVAAVATAQSLPPAPSPAAPGVDAPHQAADSNSALAEVVVTGTSLRGVSGPVGSNVQSVGQAEMEHSSVQSIQDVLRMAPALTGFTSTPQGGNPGNDIYMPAIHGLGSSSSNATLVLVDGHRISPGSQQQTLYDPDIIPPIMLERVDILAEGASATYGSDAVAGVINFITRKSFDGVEVTAQGGVGDGYNKQNVGFLWGTHWANSSILFGYNYDHKSDLLYSSRSFLDRNHTAQGGTNFDTFFCAPATIQPAGSSLIYPSARATTPVANTAANASCQNVAAGAILPDETRNNAMLKLFLAPNDDLSIEEDAVVSILANSQPTAVGTVTATAFDTGPQANPYYVDPFGVTATSQTIRLNGDALLGPGSANTYNNQDDYYLASNLDYRLAGDWHLTALNVIGGENSYVGNTGLLCGSCADLALNGTTNGGGSLTASSIPGTSTIVTNLPLTAGNALNVWDPAGAGNGTSAAVLAELADSATDSRWYYNMNQTRIGVEGSAFNLPGGRLHLAAGGEFVHYGLRMDKTYPNNAGPESLESQSFELGLDRNVVSFYGEAMVPIIGPRNALPLVRNLQVDLSGRFDNYMGLAKTSNPHFGLNWESIRGLTLKANYSTSFVAPQLTSVGDVSRGGLTSFSGYAVSNQTLVVPLSSFPLAASIPGATCNAQTCTVPSSVNGISVNGGPAHPEPGKGRSWSVGLQFTPSFIAHFSGDVTLFNTDLLNQISGNSASNAINSAALNSDLQFCPGGCSAAQIGSFVPAGWPQQSAIPSTVYYMLSVRQQNLLNLYTQGLDMDLNYAIPSARFGTLRLGLDLTQFLRFDQSIKGGPRFSVLNTTGFNNTFPSIETQGRADLGWDFRAVTVDLFLDYVGPYRNWSSTSVAPVIEQNGVPKGGGDHVASTEMVDLHLAYDFSRLLGGAQVFVDVTNLFNRAPVFYNSLNGYDQYTGDVLGRVSTLGIRINLL